MGRGVGSTTPPTPALIEGVGTKYLRTERVNYFTKNLKMTLEKKDVKTSIFIGTASKLIP